MDELRRLADSGNTDAVVLEHYLTEVRPCFEVGSHPAPWVTERCRRLCKSGANEAFETLSGLTVGLFYKRYPACSRCTGSSQTRLTSSDDRHDRTVG
jgi:hypothetical protein